MRGKLTDQDLNNYALNDGLEACERLYVESMLAVSEECRHDVCAAMEFAQLLEQGFERENTHAQAALTEGQRFHLLNPPRPHPAFVFLRHSAAAVALAACVAFALVHPAFWPGGSPAHKLASASSKMSQMVSSASVRAMSSNQDDFAKLVNLREWVDDSASWLQQASDTLPQSATTCTPPSMPDYTDLSSPR